MFLLVLMAINFAFADEDVDDEPLRKKLKKVKKVRSDLPFKCAQKKRPINKREKLAAKNLGDFPRNSKKRLPKNSGDFPRGMGWKDPSLNQEAVASARRAARNVVADRPGACGGKWDKTQKKMMKKMKKMKKEGAQNTQVVNSRYMQFAGMDIDGGWKGNGDNTGNNLHEKKKKKKIKNNKRKYPDRNVAQNRGHGKVGRYILSFLTYFLDQTGRCLTIVKIQYNLDLFQVALHNTEC